MDLARELESYGERGALGARERLTQPDALSSLRERVARARRRANLTIAGTVIAVLGVSAAAWAMPSNPAPVQPSPHPSVSTDVHPDTLPPLDSAHYLVGMYGAYRTDEAITCAQIPDAPMSQDAIDYPGSMPPLPTWIEANRIYGMANGLPEHYPIPLYSRDGAIYYDLAAMQISQLYPPSVEVVVAFIAPDGSWWGFDADYTVIDQMPFDDAGLFLTLTPNPDCKGGPRATDGSRIPPDHYDARVMVVRNDGRLGNVISDHGDVEIVTGLPSVPWLEVTE